MDLTGLTDEELDSHRREVLIEQERRATVANASASVESVVRDVVAAGAVESDVRQAVENGLATQGG